MVGVVYVAPLAIILAASFAGQWNGVFPSMPTLEHFASALTGDSGAQLRASIITGMAASAFALIVGTWSALALRSLPLVPRRILDLAFFIPSAVPSVSVGLGLLVAFSRPPLLLNGTVAIVVIAHFILISAFTYGSVSAGLARLSPDFEQVAESLGARPLYKLWHVTLADDPALSHRRLQPELCAVDGRARRDRHGLSTRLVDDSGRHLLADRSRRCIRRRGDVHCADHHHFGRVDPSLEDSDQGGPRVEECLCVQHEPAQSESDTNQSPERRAWAARNLDQVARAMLAEDERYFLRQSVSTPCLNAIVKAEGIYLEDTAGRRSMDFHGNNVHHIGYGHPRLKRAIAEQMEALPFTPRRYTSDPAIALARKLAEITPGNLSKVLLTTGGSDAIEVAIKIARAATGRYKTLSFWDAFHGAGFGAAAVGGEALFRSGRIGPLMPGAEHVAPFSSYRCPYGTSSAEESGAACARMIDYVLGREGDVAAFIAEPIRAVPYIPPPGFWAEVRKICDRHGTLLIFDEIPNGLGKHRQDVQLASTTGSCRIFSWSAKHSAAAFFPIAAVVAQPELDVGADYAFGHYTHEKNPVTSRAALTTIEIIEDEGLVANADKGRRRGAQPTRGSQGQA